MSCDQVIANAINAELGFWESPLKPLTLQEALNLLSFPAYFFLLPKMTMS
jgi:hypothetical protein